MSHTRYNVAVTPPGATSPKSNNDTFRDLLGTVLPINETRQLLISTNLRHVSNLSAEVMRKELNFLSMFFGDCDRIAERSAVESMDDYPPKLDAPFPVGFQIPVIYITPRTEIDPSVDPLPRNSIEQLVSTSTRSTFAMAIDHFRARCVKKLLENNRVTATKVISHHGREEAEVNFDKITELAKKLDETYEYHLSDFDVMANIDNYFEVKVFYSGKESDFFFITIGLSETVLNRVFSAYRMFLSNDHRVPADSPMHDQTALGEKVRQDMVVPANKSAVEHWSELFSKITTESRLSILDSVN